jgi:hypothetical protein
MGNLCFECLRGALRADRNTNLQSKGGGDTLADEAANQHGESSRTTPANESTMAVKYAQANECTANKHTVEPTASANRYASHRTGTNTHTLANFARRWINVIEIQVCLSTGRRLLDFLRPGGFHHKG